MMFTGEMFKLIRIRKRLKQFDVAKQVGISPSQLCLIEREDYPLTDEMKRKLAEALAINEQDEKFAQMLLEGRDK